jgi:hypothetical protein
MNKREKMEEMILLKFLGPFKNQYNWIRLSKGELGGDIIYERIGTKGGNREDINRQ